MTLTPLATVRLARPGEPLTGRPPRRSTAATPWGAAYELLRDAGPNGIPVAMLPPEHEAAVTEMMAAEPPPVERAVREDGASVYRILRTSGGAGA